MLVPRGLGMSIFCGLLGRGLTLLTNTIGWTSESWKVGVMRGALLGFGLPLAELVSSKGWIQGVLRSPRKREEIEQRREELADREAANLSEFRERHHRES